MHIEFTGVAGVGKSTLFNKITTENEDIYSGIYSECPMRKFPPFIQSALSVSPSIIVSSLEKAFWKLSHADYYQRFSRAYPNYNNAIQECKNTVVQKEEKLDGMLRDVAKKYQYGVETKKENEILCLDEGFYHRGVSVGVRSGNLSKIQSYRLPPSNYFDSAPSPEILFNIEADSDKIQQRRKMRDGKMYCIDRLDEIRDLIYRLCDIAQKRGVKVVHIDNSHDLLGAVNTIKEEIGL